MKKIDPTSGKYVINKEKLKKAIEVLDALDNPFREKLMRYVEAHPNSTVTNIIKGVKKVQSFVSKHLRILRLSNFIHNKKTGKEVLYKLNEQKIVETNKAIEILVSGSSNK